MRELNILLLGKSGVGKSTFINSFANYVSFESVDNIQGRHSIRVPIPCSFDVCDDEGNLTNFKMGEECNRDGNESMNPMTSGTQGCKAYQFDFEDLRINLIDTPGIVDTEGIKKDKKNIEAILDFISIFNSIDGICILLKPNEERLDAVLRYCVLELLSQLDKSAAQNIVFGFTNARGTLYRPGSTAKAIQELLAEINSKKPELKLKFFKDNYFCFDSESFRFLISKDSMEFDDMEKNMFIQSWNKSRQECVRMINYIAGLPEHDIQNTVSINKARKAIESLLKPLMDITENILENQEMCRQQEAEIIAAKDDITILKTKLYIPRSNISMEYYKYPRLVCNSKSCAEVVEVDGEQKTHYTKVCYQLDDENTGSFKTLVATVGSGGLVGMVADALGSMSLASGAVSGMLSTAAAPAFAAAGGMAIAGAGAALYYYMKNEGCCSSCSCAITDHFITYYETRKSTERIVDEVAKTQMETEEDTLLWAESCLKFLQLEHKELQDESIFINKASSTFALFLKYRAITPYNDAAEEYLNYLIEVTKNDDRLSQEDRSARQVRLEEQKLQYQKEKTAIENGCNGDDGMNLEQISPEYIDIIVSQLCKLKRYGHLFRDSLGQNREMRKNDNRFRIVGCNVSKVMTSLFRIKNAKGA